MIGRREANNQADRNKETIATEIRDKRGSMIYVHSSHLMRLLIYIVPNGTTYLNRRRTWRMVSIAYFTLIACYASSIWKESPVVGIEEAPTYAMARVRQVNWNWQCAYPGIIIILV